MTSTSAETADSLDNPVPPASASSQLMNTSTGNIIIIGIGIGGL